MLVFRQLVLLCALVVISYPELARAQAPQPQGGQFQANTYTADNQNEAAVGMASNGDFVVVWQSGNEFSNTAPQDGSLTGVYGQRYSANGTPAGTEFQVNTFTNFKQYQADVAVRSSGEFVVVWTTEYQGGSGNGYDIYARQYTAAGVPAGAEFRVHTAGAGHQTTPEVAVDSSGAFLVVWQELTGTGVDIYARRFAANGTALSSEFRVNTTTTFNQFDAAVARNGAGDTVVVWVSDSQDGSGGGVFGQRYNGAGVAQGGEFPVNTTTINSQWFPAVGIDAAGNFVVAWEDQSLGNEIRARRYSSSGVPLSGEFLVNTYTTNLQRVPSVAMEPSGAFVIAWESFLQDGSAEGIYAQRYAADGTPLGGEFRVNTTTGFAELRVDIAAASGAMVAVWEGTGGETVGGSGSAVFGQRYALQVPVPPTAGQLQLSAATYTGSEASASIAVTVTRTGGSSGSVSASYATTSGTATAVADYVAATGSVSFAAGETSKTINIVPLDDSVDEPDETLTLALSSPTGGATLGTPNTATITIADNDDAIPNPTGPFYLAEGATGPFFELEFAVANPNLLSAPIEASFLRADGSTVTLNTTLLPTSRSTIKVNDIPGLEQGAMSTVIASLGGLPLIVERTMMWDRTSRYGGHTERAGEGARRQWFFAEGSQGFFDTYLLLANPQPTTNEATVTFLVEGQAALVRTFTLGPTSRQNVYAGSIPELVGKSFGMTVSFAEPGAAERSMYFGSSRLYDGGHASVGIAAPATSWFHAEGATGPYFDTYILVANPNGTAATVTYRFLLPSGVVITRSHVAPANSRITVNVENEHPLLADTAVSTQVTADLPIVSERAMYWPGTPSSWFEAHNSFGLTAIGPKWGMAEGRVGGAESYETYILLANPGNTDLDVSITYLRSNGTTLTRTYRVNATSRYNVHVNSQVPELANEQFGAVIQTTQPIAVERALYWNAFGTRWAAGTNGAATLLP